MGSDNAGRVSSEILIGLLVFGTTDTCFGKKVLKQAIGFYTQSTKYLKKIKQGAFRIDINGRPQSTVKNIEEKYAKNILKKRKSIKSLQYRAYNSTFRSKVFNFEAITTLFNKYTPPYPTP